MQSRTAKCAQVCGVNTVCFASCQCGYGVHRYENETRPNMALFSSLVTLNDSLHARIFLTLLPLPPSSPPGHRNQVSGVCEVSCWRHWRAQRPLHASRRLPAVCEVRPGVLFNVCPWVRAKGRRWHFDAQMWCGREADRGNELHRSGMCTHLPSRNTRACWSRSFTNTRRTPAAPLLFPAFLDSNIPDLSRWLLWMCLAHREYCPHA